MKIFYSLLLLILTTGLSCTQNDAQREFEQQAYQPANGYTETTSQGEVLSTDENDWKIAPLFQGLIEVVPPFPNPSNTTAAIQFEIEVTGVQAVAGLEVVSRTDENDPTAGFNTLYYINETLQPGLTTYQINPRELGRYDTPESIRGLHRIFLFDGNQQMISYGDIMIE